MHLDNELKFSAAQAITDDAYSSNVIDRGVAGALGDDLYLVCRVHTAFVSAGGATLQIKVRTDGDLSGGNLASGNDLLMSKVLAVADLAANTEVFKVKLPAGLERYIQVYYEVGTSTFSAGKMDAFLVPGVEERP